MTETSKANERRGFIVRFSRWAFSWRILRRTLIALAGCATLIAIFYTEENWRGRRAWEQCKRDLTAAGYEMDWNKLIPPPVPDEENIFKAPHMQEWFVRPGGFSMTSQTDASTTNFLLVRLKHPNLSLFGRNNSRITNTVTAVEFLDWSKQFKPEFDLIRTALQRPYARMEGDYSRPFETPIQNFRPVISLAQTFGQRAHCHLLLGRPDEALADLTFVHTMRKLLLGKPTSKPMTLIAAMIHVAISGLYTTVVEEGLQTHAWQETHLIVLENQLAELNLPAPGLQAFRCELTATSYAFEKEPFRKLMAMSLVVTEGSRKQGTLDALWEKIKGQKLRAYDCLPRGWVYQNLVVHARLEAMILKSIEGFENNISPLRIKTAEKTLLAEVDRRSLFNLVASVAIPNYIKAFQTTAKNQTAVNQARIVCALERYRLANGAYPESLTALMPQFLPTIPNDLIGGQPLKYQRASDGSFLLYSVGWNETDDGGTVALTKGGNVDFEKGDWGWPIQSK